jgi:hypothetical protein
MLNLKCMIGRREKGEGRRRRRREKGEGRDNKSNINRNTTVYLSLKSTLAAPAQTQVIVQLTTAADLTHIINSFYLTIMVVGPTPLPKGLSR